MKYSSPLLFALGLAVAGFAVGIAPAAEPAGLPAESPLKVRRTAPFHYPLPLLRDGIKRGEASVLVEIDSTGKLTDLLPIAYTDALFADEARETIGQWQFEPVREHGAPIGTVVEIVVSFTIDGIVAVERFGNGITRDLGEPPEGRTRRAHGLKTLDRIPVPTRVVPPVYPEDWRKQGLAGRITVEFYIDDTGRTRLPTVNAGAHPLLGASAITAVKAWRFEPPVYRGQPVLARIQQVFNFSPDTSP